MRSEKSSSSKQKQAETSVFITSVDSCFTAEIRPNTKGRDLLDAVCKKFDIFEKHWFGLYYFSIDNEGKWLEMDQEVNLKKIQLQAGNLAHFDFRARCYPECAKIEIIQDIVKIFFFKSELHRMLTSTESYVPPEEIVCAIVAFICLLHHENPSLSHEVIFNQRAEKILSQNVIKKYNLSREEWIEEILSSLKIAADQDYMGPIEMSLKMMEQSPSYGVQFYEIKNKRGTDLIIGVDCLGMNIYQKTNRYKPVINFAWDEVHSVSYEGRLFKIKMVDKKAKKFKIVCKSVIQSEQIMIQVILNHKNFLARRSTQEIGSVEIHEAKRRQEIENNRRKIFQDQKQTELQYNQTLNEIVKSGEINEHQQKLVQESYEHAKNALQERLENAILLEEREKENTKKNEALEAAEKAKKLALKIADDEEERKKFKEEYNRILMENERISREETQRREVEALRIQLCQVELQHDDDMIKIEALKKVSGDPASGAKELKKIDYKEVAEAKTAELETKIQEFRKHAMKKGGEVSTDAVQYQEFTKGGHGKFQTLKMLRKNNTRARIDEFEALY